MAPSPENAHDLLIRDQERLRALARALLRDPQAADDVVQDAWLVVAAKPRRPDKPQAWLRTVTRNLALRRIRSTGRRRNQEQRAARRDRLPSTVERVEAIELRRRLLDAVESLDEPYRSTIVWRYLDGLPPSAIARKHNMPVKTVKTRLARGLKQLRERLDRTHGDRRAWAMPLAAIVWPNKAVATASTMNLLAIGGVVMAAKTLVAAGVLIVIALGVWAVVDRQQDVPERTPSSETPSGAREAAGATLQGRDGAGVAQADGAAPGEQAPAKAKGVAGTSLVSGVVLLADGSRKPVAGLELRLRRRDKHPIEPHWTLMTTGADGSFRTPSPVAVGHVHLVAMCTGIASYQRPLVLADLELGQDMSEGLELLLPWSARATVVVLDMNQAPIVGAKVGLFHANAWHQHGAKGGTMTDDKGAVVVEHLPPDQSLVAVASMPGYGPVRSKAFVAGTLAQDTRIVLHATPGARVRGRVERADGSRAADVQVGVSYSTPGGSVSPVPPAPVRTDANGLFEMSDVAAGSYQFRADLGGTTAATEGLTRVAAGDTIDVHLRPAAEMSISGVVVDEAGKAWTADRRADTAVDSRGPVFVTVGALQHRSGMAYPDRVPLDDQGRFKVNVPTGSAYRLDAGAPRRVFATSETVEAEPGASHVRLVWRQPHTRLVLQVLDARTRAPLKGAEVVLSRSRGQQTMTTRRHCGADGELHGPWVGAGTYQVFVFAAGHCYDQAAIEIAPKEKGDHRHVLRLGHSRSVRGHVKDRLGKPLAGRRIGILLPGAPGWFEDSLVVTDEHGAFTVEGLRPRGGRIAVYNEIGDTRWQADASGDDVVIVVRSP